jgi:hypothetical protein
LLDVDIAGHLAGRLALEQGGGEGRAEAHVALGEPGMRSVRRVAGRGSGHAREQLDHPGRLRVVLDDAEELVDDVEPGRLLSALVVSGGEDREEELLLAAEVVQQAGLGEVDRIGELTHRRTAHPVPVDDLEGHAEDLLALGHALRVRTPTCHAGQAIRCPFPRLVPLPIPPGKPSDVQ